MFYFSSLFHQPHGNFTLLMRIEAPISAVVTGPRSDSPSCIKSTTELMMDLGGISIIAYPFCNILSSSSMNIHWISPLLPFAKRQGIEIQIMEQKKLRLMSILQKLPQNKSKM